MKRELNPEHVKLVFKCEIVGCPCGGETKEVDLNSLLNGGNPICSGETDFGGDDEMTFIGLVEDQGEDIETTPFIASSSLVPEDWRNWFWEAMSTDAPFSWGDNNRTLVTRKRFLEHALECVEDYMYEDDEDFDAEIEAFKARLESLPEGFYIDLEN